MLEIMEEEFLGIDLVLLTKYLNNETDESETLQVNEWCNASSENKIVFEKIQKAWNLATAGAGIQEWEPKKSKEQLLLKLLQAEIDEKAEHFSLYANSWKIIRNVIAYAAVILLFIGIPSLFIYRHFFMSPSDSFEEKILTQISAPKGSKTEMVLADGSKVWLNAGSVLKYGTDFNKSDREVFLDGEAYFDVAKNKNKPFLVHTSKLTLRVLGTSFNVKSYSDEKTIETTLVRGSVKVEKSEKDGSVSNYLLKPNQKVIFNKTDGDIRFYDLSDKIATSRINKAPLPSNVQLKSQAEELSPLVEKDISWKEGYFLVNDETLESIMVKLIRRFDLKVVFNSEAIKNLRYSGKIKESTPEQILKAIKITSPIDYTMHDKTVVISESSVRKEEFIKK
jgi:ferric-dicitrate binding protein FerR (iron transport regulator)